MDTYQAQWLADLVARGWAVELEDDGSIRSLESPKEER